MLESLLVLSVNNVAASAFAAGLIDRQLLDSVIERQHMTRLDRTLHLLSRIQSKMRHPEEASVVMKEFIGILEEDVPYQWLVARISELAMINFLSEPPKILSPKA